MTQGTNAAALIRLQPLQNNNAGAIVEEHIRWWTQFNADQAAKDRAAAAAAAKFKADQNAAALKEYDGLRPAENKGFLNAQIIGAYEKNKPRYKELAVRYANGDMEAGLQLKEEKEKLASLSNINKVYGEKASTLDLQESQGLYNEYLDEPYKQMRTSLSKGLYKVNEDLSVSMFVPDTEEVITVSPSELLNNDYLNWSYHKKANFTGNGSTIAKNLLDSNDGNQLINDETRVKGIRLVNSLLGQDEVEARSWYGYALKNGLVNFNKPFGSLSEAEMNKLSGLYYDQNVRPNIQQTVKDTSLDDALKAERLAKLRRERKEAEENFTTISPSTDEQGNFINELDADVPFVVGQGDRVFNLKGEPISFGVKGNSNTNVTYTDLIKKENGQVFAVGKQVIKESVPVMIDGEDGKQVQKTDSNGQPVTRVQERSVDVVEYSPRVVNNIVRLLQDKKGNSFENLNEASNFMDSLLLNSDSNTNTNSNTKGILD